MGFLKADINYRFKAEAVADRNVPQAADDR